MLIDVTRLVHRNFRGLLPTGIDRVSLAYLERYGERAAALLRVGSRWLVLDRHGSQPVFDALTGRRRRSRAGLAACIARGLVAQGSRDRRHRLLINAGHSGLEQARYAREVKRRQLRAIYFVHDLIPLTHPEYARPRQEAWHRQRLDTALDSGRVLIVNSQATCAELSAYARGIHRRLPQCVVAPLAPAALPRRSPRAPLAEPYFMVLGTIEPRKNHGLLLQLWRALAGELGDAAPRLVIIGQPGWQSAPVLRQLRLCPQLRRLVHWRARCTDAELADWFGHARALLFPSFVEGYGLPLVEALSAGVPVIASRLPVFRELAGDIPEFLDPLDGQGWRSAILDYVDPAGRRTKRQRERMAAFVAPTWDEHFAAVDPLVDESLRPTFRALPRRDWAHAARA